MRWHRRLTTTQQMEIQASHYAKNVNDTVVHRFRNNYTAHLSANLIAQA